MNLLAEILDLLAQFRQLAAQGCRQCGDQAIDLITQASSAQQSGQLSFDAAACRHDQRCTACALQQGSAPESQS